MVNQLVFLFVSACAIAQDCETDNSALRAMPTGVVQVLRADGSQFSFGVKVANKNRTRAAGFQRVCQTTIAKTPILFLFSSPFIPRFHMNNVVAPIDIAFIREDGSIDSVQAMKPYDLMSKNKPLYSPGSAVIATLEGHEGFFVQGEIDATTNIRWSISSPKLMSE